MAEEEQQANIQPDQSQKNKVPKGKKSGKKERWRNRSTASAKKASSSFKGAVGEMNGHVFEIHSESSKSIQFQRTIDELCMYMSRKYEYGGDMAKMITEQKEVDFDAVKPAYPVNDSDQTDMAIWTRLIEKHVDRLTHYNRNKDALFMIIWGQCSDNMQAKLKTIATFDDMRSKQDCLGLLKGIQGISYKMEFRSTHTKRSIMQCLHFIVLGSISISLTRSTLPSSKTL